MAIDTNSTPKPSPVQAAPAQPVNAEFKSAPGSAGRAQIRELEQTARGDKLLGAETKPQQLEDIGKLGQMLADNSKQQVAEAAFVGTKPAPAATQSQAESKAAAETSARAETEWKTTQRAGAAQADNKVANLKDASATGIQTAVEERARVIDAIKHAPVEAAVAETKPAVRQTTPTIGETGAEILDGPTPPKKGPSPGVAPASPVAAGEARAEAAARPTPSSPSPAGGKPVAGSADVAFNAAGTEPATAPRAPIKATVSNFTTGVAVSPNVVERPTSRFARVAAVADAKFGDVLPAATSIPVNTSKGITVVSGTAGAPNMAVAAPLGITQQTAIPMDTPRAAAQAEAATVQAKAQPQQRFAPKGPVYGATVGTGGMR